VDAGREALNTVKQYARTREPEALLRASRPRMPTGENAVHARMRDLRNLQAKYMARGYPEVPPGR
jgi:hypothetical protein